MEKFFLFILLVGISVPLLLFLEFLASEPDLIVFSVFLLAVEFVIVWNRRKQIHQMLNVNPAAPDTHECVKQAGELDNCLIQRAKDMGIKLSDLYKEVGLSRYSGELTRSADAKSFLAIVERLGCEVEICRVAEHDTESTNLSPEVLESIISELDRSSKM